MKNNGQSEKVEDGVAFLNFQISTIVSCKKAFALNMQF